MNPARTALRLREHMESFLRILPVCKAARRFSLEALYGICESQSLQLSQASLRRLLAKKEAAR